MGATGGSLEAAASGAPAKREEPPIFSVVVRSAAGFSKVVFSPFEFGLVAFCLTDCDALVRTAKSVDAGGGGGVGGATGGVGITYSASESVEAVDALDAWEGRSPLEA